MRLILLVLFVGFLCVAFVTVLLVILFLSFLCWILYFPPPLPSIFILTLVEHIPLKVSDKGYIRREKLTSCIFAYSLFHFHSWSRIKRDLTFFFQRTPLPTKCEQFYVFFLVGPLPTGKESGAVFQQICFDLIPMILQWCPPPSPGVVMCCCSEHFGLISSKNRPSSSARMEQEYQLG